MIATVGFFNRPLNLQHPPPSLSKRSITYSIPFTLKASLRTTPPPQLTSLLKSTCVAVVTAALFFSASTKHSSATITSPPLYETEDDTTTADEENERIVTQHLISNPLDIDALTILMEIKIKKQQLPEAINIVDKLLDISPNNHWRLLRAHLHSYIGDFETAKSGFEQVLSSDPLSVEAYHGLAMTASASESESESLDKLFGRIENAMEKCKEEKRNEDLRDFKLLVAQIKFIGNDYVGALEVYRELSKEDPKDFRPYLYQGIIYTLLRKTNEAKEQFDKYKKFVPKDHPYARYFEDNIVSTEAFTEVMQNRNLIS